MQKKAVHNDGILYNYTFLFSTNEHNCSVTQTYVSLPTPRVRSYSQFDSWSLTGLLLVLWLLFLAGFGHVGFGQVTNVLHESARRHSGSVTQASVVQSPLFSLRDVMLFGTWNIPFQGLNVRLYFRRKDTCMEWTDDTNGLWFDRLRGTWSWCTVRVKIRGQQSQNKGLKKDLAMHWPKVSLSWGQPAHL